MSILFSDFHEAQRIGDGRLLASCLAPANSISDPRRLWLFSQLSNYQTVQADVRYHVIQDQNAVSLAKPEANQWVEIFVSLWKCIKILAAIERRDSADWNAVYKSYREVCVQLCRGYTNFGFQAWTVPCLYTAGKYLRIIAGRADAEANRARTNGNGFSEGLADDLENSDESHEKLTDTARVLQQMFNVCRTDDSELAESRKWGIISVTNLIFKTYFKLNNIALCKNIIAALEAPGVNIPPLQAFPKSHRCTYAYYRGVLEFLRENYAAAEAQLGEALSICYKSSVHNREQILTYYIPAHIITHKQLPKSELLSQSPSLGPLLLPLCKAIKSGNLSAFDRALNQAEPELVERRIYLTLERSRDLCMRNLFRKVFLNAGWEETKDANGNVTGKGRRTRIRIEEFEAAIRAASKNSDEPVMIDRDEAECFLANMIYQGYMKGYIAREQGKVVLSKTGAFPGTEI